MHVDNLANILKGKTATTLFVAVFLCLLLTVVDTYSNAKPSNNVVSQNTVILLDSAQEDSFHKQLPRLQLPSSLIFLHESQVNPNIDELPLAFEGKNNVRFYYLVKTPKEQLAWFLNYSASSSPSRISGWRESNLLYSHPIYLTS